MGTSQKALIRAWSPGGAEWKKQRAKWTRESKGDPDVGGARYGQSVRSAAYVLERFGDNELAEMMEATALLRHPAVLRLLAKIGDQFMANRFYGNTTPARRRAKRTKK